MHDRERRRVRAHLGAMVCALALLPAPLDAAPRLHGQILGPGGRALENVRVRLYVNGAAAASAWADSTGAYAVDLPDAPAGATMLAWFIPVDDELVPECVILTESPALADPTLLPCVPRVSLGSDGAVWSPTLLDPTERMERLKALPCFQELLKSSR
jgi:hypothetical protein